MDADRREGADGARPKLNHWWHVTLYVTSRGLGTSPIPYGDRQFEIVFDFLEHALVISCSDGRSRSFPLGPRSVADFYRELMARLRALGIEVRIWPVPVEVPSPIRFTEDRRHASYDREYVGRLFQILVRTDAVFKEFRGRFAGKCSPVHFFWGAFDLAVTRFSGRPAPKREGADPVTQEAYSDEVISHGFWPGGSWPGAGTIEAPMYYSYTVPEPAGLRGASICPPQAFYIDDGARSGSIVLKRVAGRGGHVTGELEQAFAHGIAIEGLVTGENKGGYA